MVLHINYNNNYNISINYSNVPATTTCLMLTIETLEEGVRYIQS